MCRVLTSIRRTLLIFDLEDKFIKKFSKGKRTNVRDRPDESTLDPFFKSIFGLTCFLKSKNENIKKVCSI